MFLQSVQQKKNFPPFLWPTLSPNLSPMEHPGQRLPEHSQIIRIGELDGVLQLEQNTVHRNDTQRRSSRRRIIANGGHTRDRLVFH